MDSDRLTRAMARIEAAATRIEAAAHATSVPASHIDPALQGKYDDLRREADTALAQLDALIEGLAR